MNNQRYGMVFSTSKDSHYFYDSGTGKVVSCDAEEKESIAQILNNKLEVEEACRLRPEFGELIEKENLFACPEKRKFKCPTREEFRELIKSSCEQIILELTEACNLRCGYCIYNEHHPEFRGFGTKNLDFETAKKGIDFVLEEYKKDKFSLTFYGGEPLVNFGVMKKSIEYTQERYPHLKLHIAFTTNLTLLTEEMVEFFRGLQNVSMDIMCSLDGPRELHNKYRCYKGGKGSFDDAVKGFKLLYEKYYDPAAEKTISINCVMAPPYSKEKMAEVNRFFVEELKIPEEITCNYSYMDRGEMVFDFDANEIIADDDDRKLESSPLEEWAVDDLFKDKDKEKYSDIVSTDMARVSNRMKSEEGILEETYLHGNCIPGQRRIYVTVEGEFKACEKIGTAPVLGNCEDGYDFEKVYKIYIEDYAKYFEEKCNKCWARTMCSICYERTMGKDGVKPDIENKVCGGSKRIIKDLFVNYYRFFEKDKELLEKLLSKYEIS